MALIGISTTVPVEIIYAAGHIPVDLNNIFITSHDPAALTDRAEMRGFPRNLCSWVKGIYGVLQGRDDISRIIAVIEGDCSNSCALMEILSHEGREVWPFSFPFGREKERLALEIERLMERFSVSLCDVMAWKDRLDMIRKKVAHIDLITWQKGVVSGFENHYYLINCSDFMGSPGEYEKAVDAFLADASQRKPPAQEMIRLGLVGVPPIFSNLYQELEKRGARIYYNETQRQFSMPHGGGDLTEQYFLYTYPYGIRARLADIREETERRHLHGIIHYTQMFCHHQMEHMVLRESVPVPMLLLEGDRPGVLDERTILRIESFLEMVR